MSKSEPDVKIPEEFLQTSTRLDENPYLVYLTAADVERMQRALTKKGGGKRRYPTAAPLSEGGLKNAA
jgi:hypothetical protein